MAVALLWPCAQSAAERWHGSIGVASDHVWRGVSQSVGDPAAQAALGITGATGWYLGAWASATPKPDLEHRYEAARYEVDLFAGYRSDLSDHWLLDIGVIRYSHPDDARLLDYDYTELLATLSYAQRISLTVAVSPDTSMYTSRGLATDATAIATEMSVVQPIPGDLSLTGGVGYYDLGDLFSTGYTYWSAGLALTIGRLAVDVTHIQTDRRARQLFGAKTTEPRTVISAILAF